MRICVQTANSVIYVPDCRDVVLVVLKVDCKSLEHVDERWRKDKQVVWISLVVSVVLTGALFVLSVYI